MPERARLSSAMVLSSCAAASSDFGGKNSKEMEGFLSDQPVPNQHDFIWGFASFRTQNPREGFSFPHVHPGQGGDRNSVLIDLYAGFAFQGEKDWLNAASKISGSL